MPEVARIWVTAGADVGDAEHKLGALSAKIDEVRGRATSLGQTGRVTSAGLGSTAGAMAGLAKGATGVALASAAVEVGMRVFDAVKDKIQDAAEAVLEFSAYLEQAKIAWKVFLGGGEEAEVMLERLKAFSMATPFEFKDLERAARRMVAMGFAAKDVLPLLLDIGNAASSVGLGSEGIDRIVLALSQMQAKARVNSQEMRQLAEAGVPAWELLARAMGKPVREVMKLAEEGKISSKVFFDAFHKFAQQKWGGMMEEQSRTFIGAMTKIRDILRIVGSTAFRPLFDAITRTATKFLEFLRSPEVAIWATKISSTLQRIIDFFDRLSGIWARLRARLGGALSGLGEFIRENLMAGLAPIIAWWLDHGDKILAAINKVVTAVRTFISRNLDQIGRFFSNFRDTAITAWGTLVGIFLDVLDIIAGIINGDWATVWNSAKRIILRAWQFFVSVAASHARMVGNIVVILARTVGDKLIEMLKKLQAFATAMAVVSRRTGGVPGNVLAAGWEAAAGVINRAIEDLRSPEEWQTKWEGAIDDIERRLKEWGENFLGVTTQTSSKARLLAEFWLRSLLTPTINLNDEIDELRGHNLALATAEAVAGQGASELAFDLNDLGGSAKRAGDSIQNLISDLVTVHPAVLSLQAREFQLQLAIAGVNASLRAHQRELKNAQDVYQAMQERLAKLQEQLSEAQQQLDELSRPRLKGMGELEDKMRALEIQLKRLRLAELLGVPLEQVMSQFPPLSSQMEAWLATLPRNREELERLLEQLQLTFGLRFDEQLRQLQEMAEGPKPAEMTFEQAARKIRETRTRINELTDAISAQQAAMAAQQAVIDSIQQSIDGLNETLETLQEQLGETQRRQELVRQALELVYAWLLSGRQGFTDLGAEGQRVAGIIDEATKLLLGDVNTFALDTSAISNITLAQLVANYQTAMAQARLEVMGVIGSLNLIPRDIYTTVHVRYVEEGSLSTPPGRQFGGSVLAGHAYIVGERGPELFVPRTSGTIVPTSGGEVVGGSVIINVHGSVISERDLADTVRRELLQIKRSGRGLGLS